MVYLYVQLAQIWPERNLLDRAEALFALLKLCIEQDQSLDIVAGCAGLIPILLGFNRARQSCEALQLAELCAQKLLDHAEKVTVANE